MHRGPRQLSLPGAATLSALLPLLALLVVSPLHAANPVPVDAAEVVTKLYHELPEMHTVSATINLERNDTAFQWLEYQVRALAREGVAVDFSVDRRPKPRFISDCGCVSPTFCHIRVFASMLHERPDWKPVHQFETCWISVLHEMENAFQRDKFSALYARVAAGSLTREKYVAAILGYEMESTTRSLKKYHQLREHYLTGMGVEFKYVTSSLDFSISMDRKELISLYAGEDLGAYYRETFDELVRTAPRRR